MKYFVLFLAVATVFLGFKIFNIKESDFQEYQALLKSSSQKKEETPLSFLSEHSRKGVVKEIFWGDKKPLYIRIECEKSELACVRGRGFNGEIVEKMENVKSFLQEKLFYVLPDGRKGSFDKGGNIVVKEGDTISIVDAKSVDLKPLQEVRTFEATKGICSYTNFDFVGVDVKMKKYKLQGHTPSPFAPFDHLNPISRGEGKKLHCALKDKKIDLRLDAMVTTFNPKEGI